MGVPLGLLAIPVGVSLALGIIAFVVVSGGALAVIHLCITTVYKQRLKLSFKFNFFQTVIGSIFLALAGLFRNKDRCRCPPRRVLVPCACSVTVNAQGECFLTFTCPQGVALQEIWEVFHRIPVRNNIDTIVLNLPAGATAIPADFLGSNRARVLQLIGPVGTTQQNILTVA